MRSTLLVLLACLSASPVAAQVGLAEKVYGAKLEPGVTELEARLGRATGGPRDGADALTLEVAHHFSDRFYGAVLLETAREPRGGREVEAIAFEGIVHTGRIPQLGLDTALYAEYGLERHGENTAETKLLLQHQAGGFDGRLNLKAEKPLRNGDRVEFGYAASADWALAGDLRAGAAAFGDFGGEGHAIGPILKNEVEHLPGRGELGIEAGYLVSVGKARDEAKGQIRLLLEYEFHF